MLLGDLRPLAGPRNGSKAGLRGAPVGDYPHGGRRIFARSSGEAGGTGGGHSRGKVQELSDRTGESAAEFSAGQRTAGGGAAGAPWDEIYHLAGANPAGTRAADAGRHVGA